MRQVGLLLATVAHPNSVALRPRRPSGRLSWAEPLLACGSGPRGAGLGPLRRHCPRVAGARARPPPWWVRAGESIARHGVRGAVAASPQGRFDPRSVMTGGPRVPVARPWADRGVLTRSCRPAWRSLSRTPQIRTSLRGLRLAGVGAVERRAARPLGWPRGRRGACFTWNTAGPVTVLGRVFHVDHRGPAGSGPRDVSRGTLQAR